MSFKTNTSALLSKSLREVEANFADPANRKKLGELTFFDLLLENPNSRENKRGMGHGIYLFFNANEQCAYVGKTVKQGFAERIGSHFGAHLHSMGNIYVARTLASESRNSNPTHQDFEKQIHSMRKHSIAMVNLSDWQCTAKTLQDNGSRDFDWENWHDWVPRFLGVLETTLQAVYCPPSHSPKINEDEVDHFLIKPKRGRGKLRWVQQHRLADKDAKFAKIIAARM